MSEFIDYANAPDEGTEVSVEKVDVIAEGNVDGNALRNAENDNEKANILLNAINQGENNNNADNILTNNGSTIDNIQFSLLGTKTYSAVVNYTYPDGNTGILNIQYSTK